jgi:hypothetical protein
VKKHEAALVAEKGLAEIAADAPIIARRLFGGGSPDAEKLNHTRFLETVGRGWPDQAFRLALLDQYAPPSEGGKRPKIGVKRFLEIHDDLLQGGYIAPPPPFDPAQAGPPVDPSMPPPPPGPASMPSPPPPGPPPGAPQV